MAKRTFDILFSALVLLATSPVMLTALFLVWRQDGHSPLYKAKRVARNNGEFTMIKIRSMLINADKSGVTSTSNTDNRITKVGHFIRRFKLDELSQFWNVLMGDMSVVGPRPNTRLHGVDEYTREEMRLLSVRPGITDLSSIVFSDEGAILTGAEDADALYNQIIRPWKSRLGLLYVDKRTLWLDIRIIWLTAVAIGSKQNALDGIARILDELDADGELKRICRREAPLPHGLPPGAALAPASA
jgi:lipopolysaccharide/colanic/teichoic acid biosynthesis glycosyltransferase